MLRIVLKIKNTHLCCQPNADKPEYSGPRCRLVQASLDFGASTETESGPQTYVLLTGEKAAIVFPDSAFICGGFLSLLVLSCRLQGTKCLNWYCVYVDSVLTEDFYTYQYAANQISYSSCFGSCCLLPSLSVVLQSFFCRFVLLYLKHVHINFNANESVSPPLSM